MERLKKHLFAFRVASLALMFLLPVGLDLSARVGSIWLVWGLLGLSAAVSALLVLVK